MTKKRKIAKLADPEAVRQKVEKLIKNFEVELRSGELRPKVLALGSDFPRTSQPG